MNGIFFIQRERYILLILDNLIIFMIRRVRPVSANAERRKSEHRELCGLFNQLIPERYEDSKNERN